MFGLYQGLRLVEILRTMAVRDGLSLMHGYCTKAKDGHPLHVYAPPIGLLGPLSWYPELLTELLSLNFVLQAVVGPGGVVQSATAYTNGVMRPEHASRRVRETRPNTAGGRAHLRGVGRIQCSSSV